MTEKIPRPMNCFLLFRLAKQRAILTQYPGANHRDISKVIAKLWTSLPEDEKTPYREQARLAKIEHDKLYPDYRYRPKKKGEIKRRRYTRRTTTIESVPSCVEENSQLTENFFEFPRDYPSASSPDEYLSSPSLSIGSRSSSSNSQSIHNGGECYFTHPTSPTPSTPSKDLFAPLPYCVGWSPPTISLLTPRDTSPSPEYFYSQSKHLLQYQQLDIDHPYLNGYPQPTILYPSLFSVQPDACMVQVPGTTEEYYQRPSYPSTYYACPPNL